MTKGKKLHIGVTDFRVQAVKLLQTGIILTGERESKKKKEKRMAKPVYRESQSFELITVFKRIT